MNPAVSVQLKRIDLTLIYPPFLAVIVSMLEYLNGKGHVFHATRGTATFAEQHAIYSQGRTLPGPIVTHADAGDSDHNYGIGMDLTHDSDNNAANGLQPDWTQSNYLDLVEAAKRFGLDSGAAYRDFPHVNLAGYVTGRDLSPLKAIHNATAGDTRAKLAAVWRYLDTHPPAAPRVA